jgi:hypothetical protein
VMAVVTGKWGNGKIQKLGNGEIDPPTRRAATA